MLLLITVFLVVTSIRTLASDYFCSFEKKSDVMMDFSPEEQTVQSDGTSNELIRIIGNPVSVHVGDLQLIYNIRVHEKETTIKFNIVEMNNQSIIGWNDESKLSTFFSLQEQSMVFTELIAGDHVAAYFYTCMDSTQ